MGYLLKVLLVIVVSATLVLTTAVGVAVAAMFNAGTVAVDIVPADGSDISVHVPAGLVDAAIWLLPADVQADAVQEVAAEARPYWDAVRAAGDELARLPDFVLVEVEGPDEHVVIEKRDQRLVVLVESDEERFRVSLPLRTVQSLLNKADGWI